MRLKLKLQHPTNSLLPLNYQHYLSAVIYKMLGQAAPAFASWLHDRGFESSGRNYKLFTFGRLEPQKYQIDRQRGLLQMQTNSSDLIVSFYVDDALQHFVQGLFLAQHFQLGDAFVRTDFFVEGVEILKAPLFSDRMTWKTRSPICISQRQAGKRYAQYLAPDHPDYGRLMVANLRRKWLSVTADPAAEHHTGFEFELLGSPHSKLIQVKNSQIRAYEFQFTLETAPELQKTAYYAGFGEKNAQGFGLVIEK